MSRTGEYIFTIVLAAMFVSILRMLLPGKGATSSLMRLAAGAFIVMVTIKPLVDIRIDDMTDYFTIIEADASQIITDAQRQTAYNIAEVITERAEAYISDIALEYGAKIDVHFEIQNISPFSPERVTITGAVSPLIRENISKILEKEFNLPKEVQTWKSSA